MCNRTLGLIWRPLLVGLHGYLWHGRPVELLAKQWGFQNVWSHVHKFFCFEGCPYRLAACGSLILVLCSDLAAAVALKFASVKDIVGWPFPASCWAWVCERDRVQKW